MDILLSQSKLIKLSQIVHNNGQIKGLPKNPRVIKDEKLESLMTSIKDNPEMISFREILVYPYNGKYVVIGGNQRLKAVKEIGYKEIPCKIIPESATIEQLRAYTIKDNNGFGEWDYDLLFEEWDVDELEDMGLDMYDKTEKKSKKGKEKVEEEQEEEEVDTDFFEMMLKDRIYDSNNEYEIPNLLISGQADNGLIVPFSAWGADTRQKKGISTYHFYVDDYRFEAIWKNPIQVLESGVQALVEPNLSLFDTTPIAYGMHQIYKKRWISRYFQECGIKVYADLNVAKKFQKLNMLGIPKGYNAFATRGYADREEYLKKEIQIAREISGKDTPNMIVYGGGEKIKKLCTEYSVLYIEQFIRNR